MDQQQILDTLIDVLHEVGEVPPASVTMDSDLSADLDLDSLLMVEVMIAAEEAFGVVVPDDVVADLTTVGDLVRHVARQAPAPRPVLA